MIRRISGCSLALALLAGAAPLHSQWKVEASAGGVSHDALGGASSASSTNGMFALVYEGPRWLHVSAGAPVDEGGIVWGAAALGGRESARRLPFAPGLDWSLAVHAYAPRTAGATGNGLVAAALPFLSAELASAQLEARSGLIHYRSAHAGETLSRTGHESGLSMDIRPARQVTIAADGRLLRIDGASHGYFRVVAEVTIPRGVIRAHGGGWTSALLPDQDWGAEVEIGIASRTSLRTLYRQDATDPLYWNGTRRYWSIGVSRRLGGGPHPGAGPVILIPPPELEMRDDAVVLRIPRSAAETAPSVAGDFNQWVPVQMEPRGGEWVALLRIEPGVHHYAFRDAAGRWFVPASVPNQVDDGFGGTNAVLIVPEREQR